MNRHATELAKLDRAREIHVAALNAGNPEVWAGCFDAKAVQMPPNQPPNVGAECILNWSRGFLAAFNAEFSLAPQEVQLADTAWAFERGAYEKRLGDGDTEPFAQLLATRIERPRGSVA